MLILVCPKKTTQQIVTQPDFKARCDAALKTIFVLQNLAPQVMWKQFCVRKITQKITCMQQGTAVLPLGESVVAMPLAKLSSRAFTL